MLHLANRFYVVTANLHLCWEDCTLQPKLVSCDIVWYFLVIECTSNSALPFKKNYVFSSAEDMNQQYYAPLDWFKPIKTSSWRWRLISWEKFRVSLYPQWKFLLWNQTPWHNHSWFLIHLGKEYAEAWCNFFGMHLEKESFKVSSCLIFLKSSSRDCSCSQAWHTTINFLSKF